MLPRAGVWNRLWNMAGTQSRGDYSTDGRNGSGWEPGLTWVMLAWQEQCFSRAFRRPGHWDLVFVTERKEITILGDTGNLPHKLHSHTLWWLNHGSFEKSKFTQRLKGAEASKGLQVCGSLSLAPPQWGPVLGNCPPAFPPHEGGVDLLASLMSTWWAGTPVLLALPSGAIRIQWNQSSKYFLKTKQGGHKIKGWLY